MPQYEMPVPVVHTNTNTQSLIQSIIQKNKATAKKTPGVAASPAV